MELLLYGFVVLSISGLLILTWIYQKKYDNHIYKRVEFISVVITFLINVYLMILIGNESDDFRDSIEPILGSSLMVNYNFFTFYVSFFYMLYYSVVELYEFNHLRIVSLIVFAILSVNFINVLYQFYYKISLVSYDAIGPIFVQFLLIYVTCFSIYQVFWGREYESQT